MTPEQILSILKIPNHTFKKTVQHLIDNFFLQQSNAFNPNSHYIFHVCEEELKNLSNSSGYEIRLSTYECIKCNTKLPKKIISFVKYAELIGIIDGQ